MDAGLVLLPPEVGTGPLGLLVVVFAAIAVAIVGLVPTPAVVLAVEEVLATTVEVTLLAANQLDEVSVGEAVGCIGAGRTCASSPTQSSPRRPPSSPSATSA